MQQRRFPTSLFRCGRNLLLVIGANRMVLRLRATSRRRRLQWLCICTLLTLFASSRKAQTNKCESRVRQLPLDSGARMAVGKAHSVLPLRHLT